MKIVAYIMSILVLGLTAKPLMHHFAHEHEVAHSSELHCCCNNSDQKSKHQALDLTHHTSEAVSCHQSSEAASHLHASEASSHHHFSDSESLSCSCNSDEDSSSNCGDEGHQCDGHCHCAFSISSSFSFQASEHLTIAEFKIDRKFIFISEYFFDLPNFVWHPPQSA